MHLKAIESTTPSFAKRDEWMANTTQFAVSGNGGQENLDKRPADVKERLRRAQERLTKYSAEERETRTLRAADGI